MSLLEKNIKAIVAVFLVLVIGGAAIAFVSNSSKTKEKEAQESYFLTEKKYFDLKQKSEAPGAAQAAPDYTQVKSEFESIIVKHPKSVAAQMSAIHLANILSAEGKHADALNILKKVENTTKGMVNFLVYQQIGLLLADNDKCQEAIGVWQSVIDKKDAAFLHNELKLQQALCYSKTNDLKKAEEILTNLSNQTANPDLSDSNISKEAEKYLRLLQFKKASGT